MSDINSVVLIGNLVRDLGSGGNDFVYTQGGTCAATLSVAVNASRKNPDGTWGEEVSFFDVKLFGKRAEGLKQYLLKGTKVAVLGRLRQERWADKQTGAQRSRISVIAEDLQLIGGVKADQSQPDNGNGGFQYKVQDAVTEEFQEDIPF